MPRSFRSSRAFTLVELLAVLAIIGVLAGILIPVLGRVRETSRTSQCSSNQRQIAIAILTAAQDNKGIFPPSHQENGTAWPDALSAYFGDKKSTILVCPSRSFEPPNANEYWQCSYSLNPRIMADLANETPRQVRVASVPRPSEVILVADGALRANGGAQGRFWQVENANLGNPPISAADRIVADGADIDNGTAIFRFRHGGRLNVAFADGHIGSFEKGTIRQRNLHIAY